MANPYLILDGYNLMHAAGIARRKYAQGDLERCRRKLEIRIAATLSPEAIARTTVVYDAFTSPGNDNRTGVSQGLRILFAPQGQDADGEIERLLNHHSAPRQIIIVSSDHRLHKAARRRKARCVDSEVFLNELESEAPQQTVKRQPRDVKITRETPAELQRWEQTFQAAEEETKHASAEFDAEYLKKLERDLKNGRY